MRRAIDAPRRPRQAIEDDRQTVAARHAPGEHHRLERVPERRQKQQRARDDEGDRDFGPDHGRIESFPPGPEKKAPPSGGAPAARKRRVVGRAEGTEGRPARRCGGAARCPRLAAGIPVSWRREIRRAAWRRVYSPARPPAPSGGSSAPPSSSLAVVLVLGRARPLWAAYLDKLRAGHAPASSRPRPPWPSRSGPARGRSAPTARRGRARSRGVRRRDGGSLRQRRSGGRRRARPRRDALDRRSRGAGAARREARRGRSLVELRRRLRDGRPRGARARRGGMADGPLARRGSRGGSARTPAAAPRSRAPLRPCRASSEGERPGRLESAWLAFVLLVLVAVWMAALCPDVSWDGLAYHLPEARRGRRDGTHPPRARPRAAVVSLARPRDVPGGRLLLRGRTRGAIPPARRRPLRVRRDARARAARRRRRGRPSRGPPPRRLSDGDAAAASDLRRLAGGLPRGGGGRGARGGARRGRAPSPRRLPPRRRGRDEGLRRARRSGAPRPGCPRASPPAGARRGPPLRLGRARPVARLEHSPRRVGRGAVRLVRSRRRRAPGARRVLHALAGLRRRGGGDRTGRAGGAVRPAALRPRLPLAPLRGQRRRLQRRARARGGGGARGMERAAPRGLLGRGALGAPALVAALPPVGAVPLPALPALRGVRRGGPRAAHGLLRGRGGPRGGRRASRRRRGVPGAGRLERARGARRVRTPLAGGVPRRPPALPARSGGRCGRTTASCSSARTTASTVPAAESWRDDIRPVAAWGADPAAWRRGSMRLGITAILVREDRRPDARARLEALGDRLVPLGRRGPAVLYRVGR